MNDLLDQRAVRQIKKKEETGMKGFSEENKEAIKAFFGQYREYCRAKNVDCFNCPMRMICFSRPVYITSKMLDHALTYFEYDLDAQEQRQPGGS